MAIENKHVSVFDTSCYSYPDKGSNFRPSIAYPEYPFGADCISPIPNAVYDGVREALHMLGLDAANYGTAQWNPLGDIVRPGDYVLIKPNLVMERNGSNLGTDCLITQPAVIAPVIDYILIAQKRQGRIVIGDAPMQECDFEVLKSEFGFNGLLSFYHEQSIEIEMIDFRELTSVKKHGVVISSIRDGVSGKIIDLGADSDFRDVTADTLKRMRVTNYDPRLLKAHHTDTVNEYYISDYVLKADVVINMPKPKSHRKAGATIALKNAVGINTRKEFLPHHTMGSTREGGDEYLRPSPIHRLRSHLLDIRNVLSANRRFRLAWLFSWLSRLCSLFMKLGDNRYKEGSWYGNDTISRTIADLNKILVYADKDGIMREAPQRKFFIVADMIVSGEKEGPVNPSPKKVGIISAGFNPVYFDKAISTLMGFDWHKLPSIVRSGKISGKFAFSDGDAQPVYLSNINSINGKTASELSPSHTLHFNPSSGWVGHVELSDSSD